MSTMKVHHTLYLSFLVVILIGCASSIEEYESIKPAHNLTQDELHARFFGTSTIYLSDSRNALIIDGFFTRQGFIETFFERMHSKTQVTHSILAKADIDEVDFVLVAHSHYDHLLDSETTAKKTGAVVVGSKTTLSLVENVSTKLINVEKTLKNGEFEISFFKTPHVEKSTFNHLLEKLLTWTLGGGKFNDSGDVYSFFIRHPKANLLIVPSANIDKALALPDRADVVFLGIGILSKQEKKEIESYWEYAVVNSCAKWVIPIHWDNFTKPLTEPLTPPPRIFDDVIYTVDVLKNLAKKGGCDGGPVKIVFPKAFEPFSLDLINSPLTQ